MEKTETAAWKKIFFSELILSKSAGQRIAYVAVIAALSAVLYGVYRLTRRSVCQALRIRQW